MIHPKYLLLLPALAFCACTQPVKNLTGSADSVQNLRNDFGKDLAFLQKHDSVLVLKSADGKAQIIVSPKYQAKVFTSTATGINGKSFGWINYKTFDAKPDIHMNAYGGEDRLWLGPEGGKFSLFFTPGSIMNFDNWRTPPAIDNEGWTLVKADNTSASMSKTTELLNYANTTLKIKLNRSVSILTINQIRGMLKSDIGDKVSSVGFATVNIITNNGDKAWDKTSGAPCLWNLDMFSPSPKMVIVIPYHSHAAGRIATTNYFGEIPLTRIRYDDGTLFFKADGKSRGKLGVTAQRARNMAGSYDPESNVLTVALYDLNAGMTYLNQEWKTDTDPFTGDAVNAYNDGMLPTGGQMGPFYEIESVSPAAFLQPGKSLTHNHAVFHFTGDKAQLNDIAMKTLGVPLKDIESVFK
jgi:hypothetical protein